MSDLNWINFGKYGQIGQQLVNIDGINLGITANPPPQMLGEWTSFVSIATGSGAPASQFFATLAAARFGIGVSFELFAGVGDVAYAFAYLTLPGGSLSRIIGGFGITPNLASNQILGAALCDGVGNAQIAMGFNASGFFELLVGSNAGGVPQTVLATSTNSISSGTSHWVEFDITINNSTGAYTIDVDGVQWMTASNVDTRGATTNNSASVFAFFAQTTSETVGNNCGIIGESFYLFSSAGGTNNAIYGIGMVSLETPASDSAVQFAVGQGTVGYWWNGSTSTNAPGANELVLVPITPEVNCTINSVTIIPEATNAAVNFKAVLYPSSGGKPDGQSLTTAGPQVTGCVAGTPLTLALTTPESLTGATEYWIGYITDTSIAIAEAFAVGDPLFGRKAANTYASGAPGTCPATTASQPTWGISGNTSGQSTNYSEVNLFPAPGAQSYLTDSTVGQADLYTTTPLPANTGSIAGVKISGFIMDSDAGPRTINLQIDSSGTKSGGSNTGITPPTTFSWENTFFDVDPHTSAAWALAAYNAITFGPIIES